MTEPLSSRSDTEAFWKNDKPTTMEEALSLLRFGAVLNPAFAYDTQEEFVDQARTERRMLACADFFDKAAAVSERGTSDAEKVAQRMTWEFCRLLDHLQTVIDANKDMRPDEWPPGSTPKQPPAERKEP